MNRRKVLLSWSGGKDSAWALHLLRRDPSVEVVALLTTFNSEFDRVAMHAVRRELMEQQAAAAGLPLWAVPLPWPCSNEQYEQCMRQMLDRAISEGSARRWRLAICSSKTFAPIARRRWRRSI